MISNPLKKVVTLCPAMAAIGMIFVAATGLSVNAAQRSATPPHQAVNGSGKTDRLDFRNVVSNVVTTEKVDRKRLVPKSEGEFRFEPAATQRSGPAEGVRPKRDATPGAVDDGAGPVARVNDEPGAVVAPVANAEQTSRNYTEEPTGRKPSSWSGWSYSKGLMERTDRRARYLWNTLVNR